MYHSFLMRQSFKGFMWNSHCEYGVPVPLYKWNRRVTLRLQSVKKAMGKIVIIEKKHLISLNSFLIASCRIEIINNPAEEI